MFKELYKNFIEFMIFLRFVLIMTVLTGIIAAPFFIFGLLIFLSKHLQGLNGLQQGLGIGG